MIYLPYILPIFPPLHFSLDLAVANNRISQSGYEQEIAERLKPKSCHLVLCRHLFWFKSAEICGKRHEIKGFIVGTRTAVVLHIAHAPAFWPMKAISYQAGKKLLEQIMSKRKKVLATLSVTIVSSLVTEVANHSHQPW